MISRWIRTWDAQYLAPLVAGLQRIGITPNTLTLLGLASGAAAGLLLVLDRWIWAAGLLLLGQVFDSLDGELARLRGDASALGAFLDSVCDHYGDLAIYLGLLWHGLRAGSHLEAILVILAMFGSVFGSHVRSRAGTVGVDTKRIGLFTRFERSLVLIAGILANQPTLALGVLAVVNNFSALQRIVYTMRAWRERSETAES
jgi:phosphatidylglycerophosphate synthase